MDPTDAFYQQLDSEALLERHGPDLAAQARGVLQQAPQAKLAGAIVLPDSREAEPLRNALATATGQKIPEGLMVALCPRQMIEPVLEERVDAAAWRDEPWQTQNVLPVVVATRDGFRFGFYRLDTPSQ